MEKNCSLCELSNGKHRNIKVYYEDDICIIVNCKICRIPQIVLKRHGKPFDAEIVHLKKISKQVFPDRKWRGYDRGKNHYHRHLIISTLSEIYDKE